MKSIQKNKYSMEVALCDFLNQNATITTSLPNFGMIFTSFSENLDTIQVISERQGTDKSGIALTKEHLRGGLLVKALDISRKLLAYAKISGNIILATEVNYTKSEMRRSGGASLVNLALLLHDKALVHTAELGSYGITSDALAAFKAGIDQFSDALPKTRLGITEKKQATTQLAALFDANDLLLEKMDALVEIICLDQPDFYQAYRNNRKVIATGRGSLALTASIKDAVSREGIRGVKVIFNPQNGKVSITAAKTEATLMKVTAKKGNFKVKSMKPGTYNVILSKSGYKEQVVTVKIAAGERTVLNAEMESE